jgi:hypothetical protein
VTRTTLLVALLLLAACGGNGDDDATPSTSSGDRTTERSTGTSVELSATSSSTTVGSPDPGGGPGPTTSPAERSGDGRRPTPERSRATTAAVPITDAARARDAVLYVAEQTRFGADTSPPLAVVDELRSAFPGLGIDDTGSASASPTSLSIESSFLITDAGPTVIGFAVADTGGRCAGGVIGERETSPGSYRYEPEPTLFETVDTSGIASCNGAEVRQLWDVRHGHR